MKLQLVGGGQMGRALGGGLLAAGWAKPEELAFVEVDAAQRKRLAEEFSGTTQLEGPLPQVDTVLAVKPWLVAEVAAGLERPGRVISVAAGITTEAIEAVLPPATPVIRVMPNTPALLRQGASAVAPGSAATGTDVSWAESVLAAVGEVVVVTEAQIDAVTGLSGSGPAYIFLVAEALADAGVTAGLSREVAKTLAHQTILGAGRMLTESDVSASELRANVTTPAGTTAAGLARLESHAVRSAFIAAVGAATERSRELGRSD